MAIYSISMSPFEACEVVDVYVGNLRGLNIIVHGCEWHWHVSLRCVVIT